MSTKYIFVTGGVVSSIGKGIVAASIAVAGNLFRGGFSVICLKKKNSSLKTGSSDL